MSGASQQGPQKTWGEPTLALFFAIFLATSAVAVSVDMPLWARLLVGIPLPFVLLYLTSLVIEPLERLVRFITLRPWRDLYQKWESSDIAEATLVRAGAKPNDPQASRVVSERLNGSAYVETVLPVAADPVPEMHEFVKNLQVPVKSVRAMKGSLEVDRWTPSLWSRIKQAWMNAQ